MKLLVLALLIVAATANEALTVHEWGTVTHVHSPSGEMRNRMNVIDSDEHILPDFVHALNDSVTKVRNPAQGHPDITMRLETPIIYFYPSKQFNSPVDVSVGFNGGALNEFYPIAETASVGNTVHMTEQSYSSVSWKNIKLGGNPPLPETNNHVWTAPRVNKAAKVLVNGESEHYLFYRGMAALPSIFKTTHDLTTGEVEITRRTDEVVPAMWLVSFKDGKAAFKNLGAFEAKYSGYTTNAKFSEGEYTSANRDLLRWEVEVALIKAGLFEEEATAMLNTWEAAYWGGDSSAPKGSARTLKGLGPVHGTRVLYVMPKGWVENHLPMKLSVDADVSRAYIGRVDLSGF